MTKLALFKLTLAVTALFMCSSIPAFGGRGGGGHGGGGGGSHGGGGGGFRGGSSSASRGGGSYSRPAPSAPSRTGGASYERPGGNEYRSSNGAVNEGARGATSSFAPRGAADGQWHSFGGSNAAGRSVTSGSGSGASGGAEGGWHVSSGNRTASSGVRSFSGQGNEVWENAPAARNVVSSSRTLSSVRSSFANSTAANSGLRSSASLSATSRSAIVPALGNRIATGLPDSVGIGAFRGAPLFGNSLNRFGFGFRGGCWRCGFGFGFGLWPGWGFGFWDPFYWDSLSWGWPGYGYYGYPAAYPYGYGPSYDDGSSYSAPPDFAPNDSYSGTDPNSASVAPMQQDPQQPASAANGAVPVVLFLKDGSVYSVRDYWVSGGQLHYVLLNGREGAFDADQLDMQRTVDENARSGVQFTLKPSPDGFAPAPSQTPPAATPDAAPTINHILAPTVRL